MPPRVRITNERIINTAVEIVRKHGESSLNARTIAAELQCSTQPIFSNFSSMEALRLAVVDAADARFRAYMNCEIERGEFPAYKAVGMAYIRFAKEEKELFKLLYMRDRAEEQIPEESDLMDQMSDMVQKNTGVSKGAAERFHLEMWAYVHGIAAMIATGFLELEWELISQMLTDFYRGLRLYFEQKG